MKRPTSVTFFGLLVLLLAAYNAWRAILAMQEYDFMQSQGIEVAATMSIVIGATWAIGFALAAVGLWRLQAWGRRWMLIAIVVYQVHIWIARLALERTSYESLTRSADAVLALLLMVGVWGFLFWPSIRRLYQASN